ncbi:MAG: hypothetical protein N3A58_08835 [Spirochaetes bacterium]|nr:hypothetical protein [Spirochaetota bacterium]
MKCFSTKSIFFFLFFIFLFLFSIFLSKYFSLVGYLNAVEESEDSLFINSLEKLKDNKYSEAINLLEILLNKYPESSKTGDYNFFLGISYYLIKNYSKSKESLLKVTLSENQFSFKVDSLYFLGKLNYFNKKYNEALSYFINYLDKNSSGITNINSYYYISEIYGLLKNKVQQEKYYKLFFNNSFNENLKFSKNNLTNLSDYLFLREKYYIYYCIINSYKNLLLKGIDISFKDESEKKVDYIEQIEAELNKLKKENEELKNKIAIYEKNMSEKISSDVNTLLDKLNKLEVENATLKIENEQLRIALNKAYETIEYLKVENNSLKNQINDLNKKVEELQSQKYIISQTNEEVKNQNGKDNIDSKLQELEKLKTDVEKKNIILDLKLRILDILNKIIEKKMAILNELISMIEKVQIEE